MRVRFTACRPEVCAEGSGVKRVGIENRTCVWVKSSCPGRRVIDRGTNDEAVLLFHSHEHAHMTY